MAAVISGEGAGRRAKPTPGASYLSSLDWCARAGSAAVLAVGTAVALGWFLNAAFLKSVLPGFADMKLNTACGFIAAGLALWLLHTAEPGSRSSRLARGLAALLAVLGGLTLSEDLFELDIGIDQFLLPVALRDTQTPHPGRMSPAAALNFLLVGSALLALQARNSRLAAGCRWFVFPALFVSTLAIVGYAYGVSSLYEVRPYTSMAPHTAISFFILTLSILAADPAYGLTRIATSDSAGGIVARLLIPTLPLAIFLLGWARLAGQQAGLYDTAFGLALMVLLSSTVSVIAVASTAFTLHRVDGTRKRAEAEVLTLNADLERRVQERTLQLDQLSAKLSQANKSLEQLSLHDGLTGLANRRYFDTYLAGQVAIARRHQRPLTLVMLDVDAFKAYNDFYGHQAGDACLMQIAIALSTCCRRPADMAARYGGEEFAMILPDTELADATRIAEAARNAVAALKIPHARSPTASYVSISGGVAAAPQTGDLGARQLIAAADQSLYQAKDLGRDRIVTASAEAGAVRIEASVALP